MPTAQALQKQLLTEHIAPFMKAQGFKRQRNRWAKRWDEGAGWLVLEVQTSAWSNREELSFTMNLGIFSDRVGKLLKEPISREKMPLAMSCHYYGRVGDVMPDGADTWWKVTAETDLGTTGRSVVDASGLAVRFLERNASEAGVWRHTKGNGVPWITRAAIILVVRGREECDRWCDKCLRGFDDEDFRRECVKLLRPLGYRPKAK